MEDPLKAHLRPINPQNVAVLHQHLGAALWQVQAFEDLLKKFVVLILKLPPSRAESEMLAILNDLDKKTLGALIKELKNANTSTAVSSFEQRVDTFLKERNWLVHHSWSQHLHDVYIPEKLPTLYRRINYISDESRALQNYFGDLVQRWVLTQGITMEEIEREALAKLKQAGAVK